MNWSEWSYKLPLPPCPKGSVRARAVVPKDPRKKPFASTYPDPASDRWEADAAALFGMAWSGPPVDAPCSLVVVAVFARPKSKRRKVNRREPHTVLPDGSNVLKAVEDAMQKGGVLRNDSRIFDTRCLKYTAGDDDEPHVHVRLRWLA